MRKLLSGGILTTLFTLLSVVAVTAQNTCSLLVENALRDVDTHCEGIERNEACYGYDMVEAEFISDVEDEFFTEPADVTEIIELKAIRTSPLDESDGTWGVAVMNIQANLPDTLPGQNVTFVLLGDTEVENDVEPDEIVTATGAEVITNDFATVRSGAGDNFNAIAGFEAGSTLIANRISPDGQWVQVILEGQFGWVRVDRLQSNPNIGTLPTVEPRTRTPMQAVYLRTGIGQPICEDAPDDILLVQGPEDFEIELTVNGATFRIGSTVSFRLIAEDLMEIFVIDGEARQLDENGNPTGLIVLAGQRSIACLNDPEDLGLDGEENDREIGCDFSEPEYVPLDEIGIDWCQLEDVPESILNYPIDIFCPGDPLPTPIPLATPTATPPPPIVIITATFTPEVTVEVTPEITPEVTVEVTPEVTPEITPEVTVEVTPEITPEVTVVVTAEVTPEVTQPVRSPAVTATLSGCRYDSVNDKVFVTVSWSGADPADSISVTGLNLYDSSPVSAAGAGASGSVALSGDGDSGISNIIFSTSPSNDVLLLGSCTP